MKITIVTLVNDKKIRVNSELRTFNLNVRKIRGNFFRVEELVKQDRLSSGHTHQPRYYYTTNELIININHIVCFEEMETGIKIENKN